MRPGFLRAGESKQGKMSQDETGDKVLNSKYNCECRKIFGEIEIMKIAPRPVLRSQISATGTIMFYLQ